MWEANCSNLISNSFKNKCALFLCNIVERHHWLCSESLASCIGCHLWSHSKLFSSHSGSCIPIVIKCRWEGLKRKEIRNCEVFKIYILESCSVIVWKLSKKIAKTISRIKCVLSFNSPFLFLSFWITKLKFCVLFCMIDKDLFV